MGGQGLEYWMGTLYRDNPMRVMVGATVMGPTKRMRGPTIPSMPITTSTIDAAIKLPDICKRVTRSVCAVTGL